MKQKFILLLGISIFLSMGAFAQYQYNPLHLYDYYLSYYNTYETEDPIQQKTIVYTSKKGKKYTSKYEYNSTGKIIKVFRPGKKNKLVLYDSVTYDNSVNKLSSISNFKNNSKLRYSMHYSWNSDSTITEISNTKGNGKIEYKNTREYTDAGKVHEAVRYGKGGEKINFVWKYVYDDKDELLQTQLFKGNGKLKHVWDFNCHEEGSILNKEKNTTQVCKWSEDRGKFLIKTYQRFDEKGKIRKYVSYYTLKDTVLVESKAFNNEDELISHSKYNSINKRVYFESFRKGKSLKRRISTYDENGKQTKYVYYKRNKLRTEYIYKYNDSNKLIEEIKNRKGEFKSKNVYTYGDNNLISSNKYYDKKMKLTGTSEFTYIMRD